MRGISDVLVTGKYRVLPRNPNILLSLHRLRSLMIFDTEKFQRLLVRLTRRSAFKAVEISWRLAAVSYYFRDPLKSFLSFRDSPEIRLSCRHGNLREDYYNNFTILGMVNSVDSWSL